MLISNAPSRANNLLSAAVADLQRGQRIAMLTLVNIEGSAPYPIGSQMLVSETGDYLGQITGGCAENALADQAIAAMQQGENQTHRYGLNSPFFDIQLPCGSGIDVYFDVTTELSVYERLADKLANREPSQLILQHGDWQLTRQYVPVERLLVFGQGPILVALAMLGVASGFEVIAIGQDESDVARLAQQEFQATTLLDSQHHYAAKMDAYTAVISLFHEHDREIPILADALDTSAFYIGALGSRRTHAKRLQALTESGVCRSALDRISGPIGLDIRAETPEQIAISILAEVIAAMPKKRA